LVGRIYGIRNQTGQTDWEECGLCPVFASYTVSFALQLRKSMEKLRVGKISVRIRKTSVRVGKTSVRVRKTSVKVRKNLD